MSKFAWNARHLRHNNKSSAISVDDFGGIKASPSLTGLQVKYKDENMTKNLMYTLSLGLPPVRTPLVFLLLKCSKFFVLG